jgi:hypothetical protein
MRGAFGVAGLDVFPNVTEIGDGELTAGEFDGQSSDFLLRAKDPAFKEKRSAQTRFDGRIESGLDGILELHRKPPGESESGMIPGARTAGKPNAKIQAPKSEKQIRKTNA